MELFFLCGLTLIILFVSFSLVSLLSSTCKTNGVSKPNLPPGRTGLPFIGESLEFLSASRKGHPEKFEYDRMAKYSSKIFRTSIFGEPVGFLCGAPGNKFLFSNENKLVKLWIPKHLNKIFSSSPMQTSAMEEALKLRKVFINFLKSDALQRYVGMMDFIAQRHFESGWEGKQEVVVFPLVKNYAFRVACKIFLSIEDPEHRAIFADLFKVILAGFMSIPIDFPGTTLNRAIKASNKIKKELGKIIKQRKIDLANQKASPTQDIMSHMLLTTDENEQHMNELEIAEKILGVLVAAHDSTTSSITMIVKYLAELPDIYRKVLTEQMEIAKSKAPGELLNWEDIKKMKYSWNVACEVMRLCPPSPGGFREAITEFTYSGFIVPKGWKLYWNASSTHKNPEYFPEPEKFDPSRFEGNGPAPYTFIPFGGGPRMCPGQDYARLVILVFMYNIVTRYKWEKLLPDEKLIVNIAPIPAKGLPVRLFPHLVA